MRHASFVLVLIGLLLLGCGGDDPSATDGDAPSDGDRDSVDLDADPIDNGDDVVDGDGDADTSSCRNVGTPGASSACLTPTMPPEYYIEQSLKYFDTLDVEADPESVPNYSALVARWEWPPWLLLTGYGKETMESTAAILRRFDPSTVPERDCRAFAVQPFGRCYIVFEYDGRPCPIYEEFTFNDQGEMTFIEAWSDLPGLLPMPDDDRWAEAPNVPRLSTRVPGLGNATGTLDLDSKWMQQAAEDDTDVAEFARRARDQWTFWWDELQAAGDDLYERGCGW